MFCHGLSRPSAWPPDSLEGLFRSGSPARAEASCSLSPWRRRQIPSCSLVETLLGSRCAIHSHPNMLPSQVSLPGSVIPISNRPSRPQQPDAHDEAYWRGTGREEREDKIMGERERVREGVINEQEGGRGEGGCFTFICPVRSIRPSRPLQVTRDRDRSRTAQRDPSPLPILASVRLDADAVFVPVPPATSCDGSTAATDWGFQPLP